ncbi:hypothetical protein Klosneuvirus_6_82 [Klosneuvirus KNV1]|uniref:Uncharacterized protein n=1 Tax=Klosneuvirus KNV1 TaxID=1977640 RepID=A0A1V0SLC0_9VIRU|nr:hypothetical protein Klosneuvirus_6_82 [Klosneuvirus KNV1]
MTDNNILPTVFASSSNPLLIPTVFDTIDISSIMGMATQLMKNMNIDTIYKKLDTTILYSQFIDLEYIEDQTKLMQDIEAEPNQEKMYYCTDTKALCKGSSMTKLHKWVLMTKEHPFLEEKIKEHCQLHPQDIDKFTADRTFTSLMLAALNLNSVSTLKTVQILLEAGADPNLEAPDDSHTVLTLISSKSNLARLDLYKLLLNYKANVTFDRASGSFSKTILENFISSCPPENEEANEIIDLLVANGADLSTVQSDNVLNKYYLSKLQELQKENESLKSYIKIHYTDPMTIKI